jgi:BlaI family penicillinase repressor
VSASKSRVLTDHELRLMEVLWARQYATVGEVVDALLPPLLAYNTVLTTLRTLEQKGYLAHEKRVRAHLYRPIITRDQAARSAVTDVLNRFFKGSAVALVASLHKHVDLAKSGLTEFPNPCLASASRVVEKLEAS